MIVADSQHLRGAPATLSVTWRGSDGEPAAVPATVTVHVVRGNSTDVLPADNPTTESGNTATVTLTAAQTATLDLLTATWTDGTTTFVTTHEIVGGFYFTVADARAVEPALTEPKYPAALIKAVRREVEEEFERICGVAFVPRYRLVRLSGNGMSSLQLPDPRPLTIRSVTGVAALSAGALSTLNAALGEWHTISDPLGAVTFEAGLRNLVVEYEHGWLSPPVEIKRAALARLRQRLNLAKSGIPDKAISYTADNGGTYRLSRPTELATGSDEIDSVLERFSMHARETSLVSVPIAPAGRQYARFPAL